MADTLSPQGQWRWDEAKQDWVPNTQAQTAPTNGAGGVNTEAFKRAALLDLLKTGGKNLTKLKAAQELISPAESAEETKQKLKISDLSKSLNILEQNYKQIETKGPVTGQLGKFLAGISGGGYNPEIADYEALRKGLIGPVARSISGEVGVLTDRDIKRAESLLPKVTDTAGLAARKLNNLRSLIKEKGGPEAPEVEVEEERGGGTAIEKLFRREQESVREKGVGPTALRTAVPALQLASPEGRGAAGEVVGALALTSLLKGGAAKKLLSPRKALGEAQTAAATKASGVKINTSKILKAGKEYIKDDPSAQKYLKTASSAIKGAKDPSQLLRKMQVWKEAYSSAGRVGKSAKAGLYNKLYKAGIEELKKKAPEVYKKRRALALSYELPKKVSQATWQALKFSALGRVLGF